MATARQKWAKDMNWQKKKKNQRRKSSKKVYKEMIKLIIRGRQIKATLSYHFIRLTKN